MTEWYIIVEDFSESALKGSILNENLETESVYEVSTNQKQIEIRLNDVYVKTVDFQSGKDVLFDIIIPHLEKAVGRKLTIDLDDWLSAVSLRLFKIKFDLAYNDDFEMDTGLTALLKYDEKKDAYILSGVVSDFLVRFYWIELYPSRDFVYVRVLHPENEKHYKIVLYEDYTAGKLLVVAKFLDLPVEKVFDFILLRILSGASFFGYYSLNRVYYPKWFKNSEEELEKFRKLLTDFVLKRLEELETT